MPDAGDTEIPEIWELPEMPEMSGQGYLKQENYYKKNQESYGRGSRDYR